MSHNVNPDLDDNDALGHLNGSFNTYRHTTSKSSHGTYLSGSAASREPMAFAAYGDYPPGLPQESYNMANLSTHGGASGSTSAQDPATVLGVAGVGVGETRVQPCSTTVCRAWRMVSARGMLMDSTMQQQQPVCASMSGARCIPSAGRC